MSVPEKISFRPGNLAGPMGERIEARMTGSRPARDLTRLGVAMMTTIRRKSLWLDANQGIQKNECAFGFIGTTDTDDYQGWFFTWPSEHARISTVAEREAVLDSLDADETCPNEEQIPYRWARQKLESYLRQKFDLRVKS